MGTWETYDGSIIELDDCTDNRVYFRADPENPNTDGFYPDIYIHYFKTDKSVKAGGNIQFLLESTGTRTDVPECGFEYLFGGLNGECSSLTTAPALPATTLAENCYRYMFRDCTSLTTAPALPATTLAERCYYYMFTGCSSLTTTPTTLPAMTLAWRCYYYMFGSCSSLTTAPALPATTLASECYSGMFYGCSNLASIDVSFTAWNPADATEFWVSGVATSGTFTCSSTLSMTTGESNIPEGWTIITK